MFVFVCFLIDDARITGVCAVGPNPTRAAAASSGSTFFVKDARRCAELPRALYEGSVTQALPVSFCNTILLCFSRSAKFFA